MGFWGVEVKPGKPQPYDSDDVQGSLYVTQATLGLGSDTKRSILQCAVGHKDPVFLCSLLPGKSECCFLNLEFKDEGVTFSVIGSRSIHLSGYFVSDEGDSFRDEYEFDSEEGVADTESDYESDADEDYSDDSVEYVDDDDAEMFAPSPAHKSGVVIEEIVDEETPIDSNDLSKRKKKKTSKDAEKQTKPKARSPVPVSESEDEHGFPISAQQTAKAALPSAEKKDPSEDLTDGIQDVKGKKREEQDNQKEVEKNKKKLKGKGDNVDSEIETSVRSFVMPPKRGNQPEVIALEALETRMMDLLAQQSAVFQRQHDEVMEVLRAQMANTTTATRLAQRGHQVSPPPVVDQSESDDEVTVDNPWAPLATPNPRNSPIRWDAGFKFEIPEFNGGLEPDELLDWLAVVEEILEFCEVPADRRVALVITRFRGRAAAWWQQNKADRLQQGKTKLVSWPRFTKLLQEAFLPHNYTRTLYQKLQNLRQGTLSVDAYTEEFYQLLARNNLCKTTDQLLSRYIGGLQIQIQDILNLFTPVTISEAHQRAIVVEKQLARRSTSLFPPFGTRMVPQASTLTQHNPSYGPTTQPPASTSAKIGPPYSRPGQCFSCGEYGHRQASCPNSNGQQGLFLDNTDQFNDEKPPIFDEELANPTIDYLFGDVGPALVIRRSCLSPPLADDASQRHTIFESTCTIGGKVCRFIVDSGSCENVIAMDAVDKLSLPSESHPQPYSIAWLQRDNNISVDRRVFVTFSIGSMYSDSIWCDVVPMDACHLLLGRPWQFDRGAIHDGRKNTYSFIFSGHNFVLLPFAPTRPRLLQETNVLFLRREGSSTSAGKKLKKKKNKKKNTEQKEGGPTDNQASSDAVDAGKSSSQSDLL